MLKQFSRSSVDMKPVENWSCYYLKYLVQISLQQWNKGPRSHVTVLHKLRTTVLYGVFGLRIRFRFVVKKNFVTKFLRSRKFELRGPLQWNIASKICLKLRLCIDLL